MEKGILIPRKGMAEVIRFLAEEEKVSLGLGTQSLALQGRRPLPLHPAAPG